MTRREQILLLLGSLNDFSYAPKASRIKGAQRTASVSEWRPCERCGGRMEKVAGDWTLIAGEGAVTDRYGKLIPCPDGCDNGKVRVDSYTGDKLAAQGESVYGTPFGMTFGEHLGKLIEQDTRHVDCPDCQGLDNVPTGAIRGERCRRCDGSGKAAIPGSWLSEPGRQTAVDDDRLGLMIDRRDKAGSYHELDLALAALPRRYRNVVIGVHVDRVSSRPPDHLVDRLEFGLTFIEALMPDPIVVPGAVRAAAKRKHLTKAKGRAAGPALKQRDKEIRTFAKEGRAVQWIAGEYELSVRLVNEIIHGQKEAA